ncbi:hypothetical protein QBC34DRAFT_180840 [Podospora aff. communis PSN243]|uniref:Uncharacterized protein n=1 Tax=Podospora aff. communis PSN243 TaxID=3040156 RepID=A0AAV9G7T3_9PEZI|nr:hypothetical protein QBC34DRAFT_180840 [Podospora aff. communis PSN243]
MREQTGRRRHGLALPAAPIPSDTAISHNAQRYRTTTASPVYSAIQGQYSSNRVRRRPAPGQRVSGHQNIRTRQRDTRSASCFMARNLQHQVSYEQRADVDVSVSYQSVQTASPARTPALSARRQVGRGRRRIRYHINLATDRDYVVGLFSYLQPLPVNHRAILSQHFPDSLIHSSLLPGLGSDPMDLPPGESRNILCPFGRVRARQYVELGIRHLGLQAGAQVEGFFVFDGPVPENGPYVYLGRNFLLENFQGRLPPPLSETFSSVL